MNSHLQLVVAADDTGIALADGRTHLLFHKGSSWQPFAASSAVANAVSTAVAAAAAAAAAVNVLAAFVA